MRQLIAITLLLGLTAHSAYANCPIPIAPGGGEDSLAAFSLGGGVTNVGCNPPRDPPEPKCPTNFPKPTNATVCACKTANRDMNVRCNGGLSAEACNGQISNALAVGAITADAQTWLSSNGWCPIVIGGALTDLCPMGCFDPETQILTAMTDDGGASYTPAAQLLPRTPLMTLSDDAGMDTVDLVSRPISRVVYGPEVPPLFAFALSNGATLRVTSHHPMVLDSGVIVEAADVQPGASFVGIDGQPVVVTAISREPASGDVFNYETQGDSQLGHVMVADGVLVGDLKLQNALSAEEKLIELRR